MYDISFAGTYRIIRGNSMTANQYELSFYASVGASMVSSNHEFFDWDSIRLLGLIAPEFGYRFPLGEQMMIRPFFSFGPGLSVIDNYLSDDHLNLVWVPRMGVEIQRKPNAVSLIIGLKKIIRSIDNDYFYGSASMSEDNDLWFIGLRFKI